MTTVDDAPGGIAPFPHTLNRALLFTARAMPPKSFRACTPIPEASPTDPTTPSPFARLARPTTPGPLASFTPVTAANVPAAPVDLPPRTPSPLELTPMTPAPFELVP